MKAPQSELALRLLSDPSARRQLRTVLAQAVSGATPPAATASGVGEIRDASGRAYILRSIPFARKSG